MKVVCTLAVCMMLIACCVVRAEDLCADDDVAVELKELMDNKIDQVADDNADADGVDKRCLTQCCGTPYRSCRDVRKRIRNPPSGEYTLKTLKGVKVQAYCEFGLGGGPYTFFHPSAYRYLTQNDIKYVQKCRKYVLLRALYTDGTQPYGLAQQLQQYAHRPVQALVNSFRGYTSPLNVKPMGSPYLYIGFIPRGQANKKKAVQGLKINGSPIVFRNCDGNPNSFISFFANYREKAPVSYAQKWNWGGVCAAILNKMRNPPSARLLPVDYYTFTETHWGGCGCFGQTVRSGNTINHKLLAMTVGLR